AMVIDPEYWQGSTEYDERISSELIAVALVKKLSTCASVSVQLLHARAKAPSGISGGPRCRSRPAPLTVPFSTAARSASSSIAGSAAAEPTLSSATAARSGFRYIANTTFLYTGHLHGRRLDRSPVPRASAQRRTGLLR